MDTRQEAEAIVAELAVRLEDTEFVRERVNAPANVPPDVGGGDAAWRPLSLAEGYPATALLFAELGHDDPRHRLTAHRHLSLAAGAVSAPFAGLYLGPASLGFAASAAARTAGDYTTLLDGLDGVVEQAVRQRLDADRERLAARQCGITFATYDVISGLSGLGRYLLRRGDPAHPLLREVLVHLVELSRPVDDEDTLRPGWWVGHGPSSLIPDGRYAQGHANLGISHGIAGPLALLALAAQHHVRVQGQHEAIRRIVGWLLAWESTDDAGPYWPGTLSAADIAEGAPTPAPAGHVGWCYGAPGIARAIQLAAQALDEPEWERSAIEAIRATLVRATGAGPAGLAGVGLCHGWAGLLHTTYRIAEDAADTEMLSSTDTLARRIIHHWDPLAPFGFRALSPWDPDRRVDAAGFLEGACGIALALHSYARSRSPACGWDQALLIA